MLECLIFCFVVKNTGPMSRMFSMADAFSVTVGIVRVGLVDGTRASPRHINI